jgi:hypothetical protein
MDPKDEIDFLLLLDDKVALVIGQVAVREPLIEVSAMIQGRIKKLREQMEVIKA